MKKNKLKVLVVMFAFSLFASTTFAQGAYVNINAGFGMSAGSQSVGENWTQGTSGNTHELVNGSFGKGLNVGGAFGYMFNENVGAELGVSYLLGGKTEMQDKYINGDVDKITASAKMLRLIPSLVITAGSEGLKPYAKFGMVIGSGSYTVDMEGTGTGNVYTRKMKFDGGLALGLSSAIGATYNLSDKMSLFGELNMINLSYAPTKSEVTDYTYDNVDHLADLTVKQKETEYVDSYTYDSTSPDSSPAKALKDKSPFGSFGINVGVKIAL